MTSLPSNQHVLTVRTLRREDFGEYVCQATNHLGRASAKAYIKGSLTPCTILFLSLFLIISFHSCLSFYFILSLYLFPHFFLLTLYFFYFSSIFFALFFRSPFFLFHSMNSALNLVLILFFRFSLSLLLPTLNFHQFMNKQFR